MLAVPRRIVQVRAQLHAGQPVQYLSWIDGKLRPAHVVEIRGDLMTLPDVATNKVFKVNYAAIHTDLGAAPIDSSPTSSSVDLDKPVPQPEIADRADFRIGNRVTFIDKNLQHRVGLIVRVNRTPTDKQNNRTLLPAHLEVAKRAGVSNNAYKGALKKIRT